MSEDYARKRVRELEEENERLRAGLKEIDAILVSNIKTISAQEARIDAALVLHTQTDASDDWPGYCMECSHEDTVNWPCPTVKVLRGEK